MLRISCTSHTTNIDVLQKIGVKETNNVNQPEKTESCLMGDTSWETHQDIMLLCWEQQNEDGKANEEEGDQDEHGSTI